ncbi:unnamed protein product, partial [Rotaria magnacalcarata]
MTIRLHLSAIVLILSLISLIKAKQNDPGQFLVGAGIYDITGQVAE